MASYNAGTTPPRGHRPGCAHAPAGTADAGRPRPGPLDRPDGDPAIPFPNDLLNRPRTDSAAAIEVGNALAHLAGWGRDGERLVLALIAGDDPIEVNATDRDLANRARRSATFVQKGLRALERSGHCRRLGRSPGRRIRLRHPAPPPEGGPS